QGVQCCAWQMNPFLLYAALVRRSSRTVRRSPTLAAYRGRREESASVILRVVDVVARRHEVGSAKLVIEAAHDNVPVKPRLSLFRPLPMKLLALVAEPAQF